VLTRRVYPSPVLVAKSRVKLILQSMQNGEINHIRIHILVRWNLQALIIFNRSVKKKQFDISNFSTEEEVNHLD